MPIAQEQVNPVNCRTYLSGGFIQKLSPAALTDLTSIHLTETYQAGDTLFSEKQAASGVYLVREGKVRLSMNSTDGKRLSLRIARAGDILGLTAVLSGNKCETTAEALTVAKIIPISIAEFFGYLSRHPDVYRLVTQEVSLQYTLACEQLRTVGLSSSAPEKLARLLLDLSENGQATEHGTRFRFLLTHEQIGEFIGASRETVTRTLGSFKHRRLVALNGSMLTIPNRHALESYAR
jgi:CRP/FNR family cyclic AMP-dependent transcriptional regulator